MVPAFAISEIKTAFQMGFMIFIPFLVIDMIVASVLMSMGMMMLPPVMISLPFKILLFVLVDGWYLVMKSIITKFLGADRNDNEMVISIAERAIWVILLASGPLLLIALVTGLSSKYFSGDNTNSRTNISICSENCCSISCDCFFWTVDAFTSNFICSDIFENLIRYIG